VGIGFKREELKPRYDVRSIHEDDWHNYCGQKTSRILTKYLGLSLSASVLLLNAGSGVYKLSRDHWQEVPVDLFTTPLQERTRAVCASIERLPFRRASFGGVVCVGEVLGYCDPAKVILEFARVLATKGILICDFGNSRSFKHWFRASYGRAADLITDYYNETLERTWVYNPAYIKSLLESHGFRILATSGTHTWSIFARRLGVSVHVAISIERMLEGIPLPSSWADVTTIVAVRGVSAT
jgi:SAM-dependent methyltransferase